MFAAKCARAYSDENAYLVTTVFEIIRKKGKIVLFYAILRLICIRDTMAVRAAIREAPIAP